MKRREQGAPFVAPWWDHWPGKRREHLGMDLRRARQKEPAEVAQNRVSGARNLGQVSTCEMITEGMPWMVTLACPPVNGCCDQGYQR